MEQSIFCFVPKGHLIIAHRFIGGGRVAASSSPKGTAEKVIVTGLFSRPSGTPKTTGPIPSSELLGYYHSVPFGTENFVPFLVGLI